MGALAGNRLMQSFALYITAILGYLQRDLLQISLLILSKFKQIN